MLLNTTANKEIITYAKSTLEKIKVIPGDCLYNYRCHLNAVHYALKNKEDEIIMCLYHNRSSNGIAIHFLNYSKGKYIDNTIGQWSEVFDYYYVKRLTKDDFFKVEDIFTEYRKQLRKELSFLTRLFSTSNF